MIAIAREQLAPSAVSFRLVWLGTFGAGLALLRLFSPTQLSAWIPFHNSCGAITGLPCLFCGTTRAMHQLLNGNLSAALYYNWLAFPILAVALALSALFVAELIVKKRLIVFESRVRLSPQTISLGCALIVCLWGLQVYLALSQHKKELLNPNGLLYAVFVK